MSVIQSGNRVHDGNCSVSEGVRQTAVAAAGNSQSAVRTAEITHFRTCLASAIANKCGIEPFVSALRTLGTGGS